MNAASVEFGENRIPVSSEKLNHLGHVRHIERDNFVGERTTPEERQIFTWYHPCGSGDQRGEEAIRPLQG